jgi:hypothetical protein
MAFRDPEILSRDAKLSRCSPAKLEGHRVSAVLDLAEVLLRHPKPPRHLGLALTHRCSPCSEDDPEIIDGRAGSGTLQRNELRSDGLVLAAATGRAEVVRVVAAQSATTCSAAAGDRGDVGGHYFTSSTAGCPAGP